ncbi:hypothetical protein [Martelella mangrovi]|uniref:Uncharacterized protein n=1 Tax=Martelella mangrovi TaxID=1397477 RepID=A0ABV2IG24_9HYPH
MNEIIDDDENFEELYGEWRPSLYDAAMADAQHFSLLVGGPRWDDPYTIVLIRDLENETFSRHDVRRYLVDIRVMPVDRTNEKDQPSYVALSQSGDIYIFGPKATEHLIVPGSLAESDDMPDIRFRSIRPYDKRFLVAGSDGFLKLGGGDSWEDVAPPLDIEYPYRVARWSILGINANGDIYVVGSQEADARHFILGPDHPLYDESMSERDRETLEDDLYNKKFTYPALKTLFIGRPGAWKRQELPERIAKSMPPDAFVSSMISDEKGDDYLIGSDGLILKGDPSDGFVEIGFSGDRDKNFYEVTLWENDLILSGSTQIYRFDGHSTSLLKVKVKQEPYMVETSKLDVQENMLYLFDYSLRYFAFDGEEWQQYDLPQELTERPFKGNPPKK